MSDRDILLQAVKDAFDSGLCIIPPATTGTKQPLPGGSPQWQQYQKQAPPLGALRKWYSDKSVTGIGLVCGEVSGKIECLDFDESAIYEEYEKAAEAAGLAELLNRLKVGYYEHSPNGVHFLYRCETISGNTKLATRPKRPEERKDENDKVKTLIETRGEGGYIIIAPTYGPVNPSGNYRLTNGSFATIPTITPEERRALLEFARTFNVLDATQVESEQRQAIRRQQTAGRPGDDFNQRGNWRDILSAHGWIEAFTRGDTTYWRRPGKPFGTSATTNHQGTDLLYVFSSSTTFEPNRGYTKFSAYSILEHGGDFPAAAMELAKQGYGEPIENHSPSIENSSQGDSGSIQDTVKRLALLHPLEYEQVRKTEATRLKVRAVELDKVVRAARKETREEDDSMFPVDAPWDGPVDGKQLIKELAATFERFSVLPKGSAITAALWVILTYCFDFWNTLPILSVISPEKRCGKTTFLTTLGNLCHRALPVSNISPAAVYRAIEAFKPALLIDEGDTFLKDNEELRGVINSGHTKMNAFVIRCDGDDNKPVRFFTWCPKAIAMISSPGVPPETIVDRSITVNLRRKLSEEKTEHYGEEHSDDFSRMRSMILKWVDDNESALRLIKPERLKTSNDRQADNWYPLLSIATVAKYEAEAFESARLSIGNEQDEPPARIQLLQDIRTIFEDSGIDRLSSASLVKSLVDMEDRPWGEWKHGRPLTQATLARMLKPFCVHSKQVRTGGENVKGYELDSFHDAFTRYTPNQSETTKQVNNINNISHFQSETSTPDVSFSNRDNYTKSLECFGVSLSNGGGEDSHAFPGTNTGTGAVNCSEKPPLFDFDKEPIATGGAS